MSEEYDEFPCQCPCHSGGVVHVAPCCINGRIRVPRLAARRPVPVQAGECEHIWIGKSYERRTCRRCCVTYDTWLEQHLAAERQRAEQAEAEAAALRVLLSVSRSEALAGVEVSPETAARLLAEARAEQAEAQAELACKDVRRLYTELERWRALRPEVQWYAEAMEAQLRANDHKVGWKDDSPFDLLRHCRDELGELYAAVVGLRVYEETPTPLAEILSEAADVGNMAMMIADVCKALDGAKED